MSLHAYQTALGRIILAPGIPDSSEQTLSNWDLNDCERRRIDALFASRGLQFTIEVQRSWCDGRARNAAYLTLSVLPRQFQQELIDAWVASGGGTSSFFASEANAFLEFIAGHLEPISHEMSICKLERAVHLAGSGALGFDAQTSTFQAGNTMLYRGQYASLVDFYVEPDILFAMIEAKQALPSVGSDRIPLLFAPGIPNLFRHANPEEARLWSVLNYPQPIAKLLASGWGHEELLNMISLGAIAVVSEAKCRALPIQD